MKPCLLVLTSLVLSACGHSAGPSSAPLFVQVGHEYSVEYPTKTTAPLFISVVADAGNGWFLVKNPTAAKKDDTLWVNLNGVVTIEEVPK